MHQPSQVLGWHGSLMQKNYNIIKVYNDKYNNYYGAAHTKLVFYAHA